MSHTPAELNTLGALSGFHGVPGKREQTVVTPDLILDPIRSIWGGIDLDPCAAPEGLVWVECALCKGKGEKKGKSCSPGVWVEQTVDAEVQIRLPEDGLAFEWIDRTYYNPPYKNLRPWLEQPHEEGARTAGLVPVRPHRKWWRAWARRVVVIYLNPFAFCGHAQTFPAPLCLGVTGRGSEAIAGLFKDRKLGETL